MKVLKWTWIASIVVSLLSANAFQLKESFRTTKNILFGCVGGGSSHINWVLLILEELSNRGHHITFVTQDDVSKYKKRYPQFNTISLGPNDVDLSSAGNHLRFLDNAGFFKELYDTIHNNYDAKMKRYKEVYDSEAIDVALCDHFTVPCIDMTKNVNTPLIITTALAISKDATAPYINNFLESNETSTYGMTFIEKLKAKVVEPLSVVLDIYAAIKDMKQYKTSLGWLPTEGIPAFEDDWQDAIKLVNNLFGFEAARPLGPLVELVGPIMHTNYPDLTPELEQFLDTRKKVAYVAFGQSVEIEDIEIELILTALLNAMQKDALDGIIWATRNSQHLFPAIMTVNNHVYDIQQHVHFVEWAPQMAILSHEATQVFVTHGGLGSLHEAIYAGVRTVVYPFYGDQPSNAYMIRTQHLGVQLSQIMAQSTANQLVEQLALDIDGEFQKHVDKFQAMVQIHSKHGVVRAADLVEEVLFTSTERLLPHRYQVDRKMSFIQSQNLDIAMFLLVTGVTGLVTLINSVRLVYGAIKSNVQLKREGAVRLQNID